MVFSLPMMLADFMMMYFDTFPFHCSGLLVGLYDLKCMSFSSGNFSLLFGSFSAFLLSLSVFTLNENVKLPELILQFVMFLTFPSSIPNSTIRGDFFSSLLSNTYNINIFVLLHIFNLREHLFSSISRFPYFTYNVVIVL